MGGVIDDMRMEELCNVVPLIKYVNLSYNNKIGVAGYKRLSDAICQSRDLKLETIDLSECGIDDMRMEELCNVCSVNQIC